MPLVTFDPNRPDFAPYGFSCVRWTPSPMRRPDHHNEIEINMLSRGWVSYLLGGRKVRMEAGHLNVFWAAIPHQILEFARDTHYFVVTIPLAWFLQCHLPERFVQPLLRGEVLAETQDHPGRDDALFAQWEEDLQKPDDDVRHVVMLEMEARLRRMISRLPVETVARGSVRTKTRAGGLQGGDLNKVERMACLIAQRYTEQLTVTEIGKEVGLHPNYAMGLFKKAFGTTLIDYLTHHRISHAQRLLATTNEKIVEVAFSSGFNSISRFNEVFRRACGCTPREYRLQNASTRE
ncbi:melibiose operon regulatory protein [mine drainage metagenome]|uniref:Melibiose operon regulatory protein n=1 Tax=mine drainage metagenome TaxID=410659 RepID=A0A1J5SI00_9ZZZZ